MDGGIDVRVAATGTTLNQGTRDGDRYGTQVTRTIAAPAHQHFFNFRVDFDVDGVRNRGVEEDGRSTGAPGGNAFGVSRSVLAAEGGRDADPAASRQWVVQ